ncbi:uncharacterized protein LOC126555927 [Aphis gossypii]|uniref:uncharacterized protein LOC126555927 n=1 Tax=Aphis gossypii TaxID=80765 RepID=UPI0021596AB3|nr:uncharacterized protein LOC126555927 [Aphis gossypii]
MRRRRLVYERTKRKKLHFGATDKDYGLAEPLIETISEELLNEKKLDFIQKLSLVNKKDIEKKTRDQNKNVEWFQERKIRLTASKFGELCKMKPYTSCKKKVHSMLYKLPAKSKEMDHGIEFESHARTQFQNMFNLQVTLCGLIVDPELPYLAASPDGLVESNSIIEIKCPYTARDTVDAVSAVNNKLLQYCIVSENNKKMKLKKNHDYYYQIIGQLHITQKEKCYFIIHTKNWTNVEIILYDNEFWNTQMANKLKLFYTNCILPEIVDPLFGRRLSVEDIRDPPSILEAQKVQNEKLAANRHVKKKLKTKNKNLL